MAGGEPGRGSASSPVKRAGAARVDDLVAAGAEQAGSALSTTASASKQGVKWPWRTGAGPLSSGRPSAFHFCRPPSSMAT